MKALVKKYAEPGIWMEDVPSPEMGVNDVIIKVTKAAICGTDLHMYKWDEWSQAHCKPPYTMGHEFVGIVVDCGPVCGTSRLETVLRPKDISLAGIAVIAAEAWAMSARTPSL